ncbi:transmembrane 4 L6 family member 4 [Lampris incognitus]|uniref:transmembrane 4 L6 family member 4 n=1 Tax=Lampris incognitus TaxID=2546036 RepID=UPI0024B53FD8|nr:transmembrane 4 L6 family member 4 [Lampris incognitus]
MLSSVLFAAVGVLGAGYSVVVSSVALNQGPKCVNGTQLTYPFSDGDYLADHTLWEKCLEPAGVVSWHISLFAVLLTMGLIQVALCAFQVVNGLLGAICGDCCGCNGGSDGTV